MNDSFNDDYIIMAILSVFGIAFMMVGMTATGMVAFSGVILTYILGEEDE